MPNTHSESIVAWLATPEAHGLETGATVEHRQTHASHVFLAGDAAIKLKKPVDFGFLDFTTPAKRRQACEDELRLNRRLAPDVYVAVQAITYTPEGGFAFDGAGETADWIVRMRRLPDDAHLDAHLRAGRDVAGDVDGVVEQLLSLYGSAADDEAVRAYGRLGTVQRNWDENFEQTRDVVGDLVDEDVYEGILSAVGRFFHVHRDVFDARADAGFVGEFHGDLRCEHVYLLPERVEIIDCIEFAARFRCCDAVNDLAFLGMDLDRLGAEQAARRLLARYATERPDPGAYALWDFFKCYRAFVRGKVAGFRLDDPEIPPPDRATARTHARADFALAARYARSFERPKCVILSGPMGCGKSTLAEALRAYADMQVLSTDVTRKQLAGVALTAHVSGEEQAVLYSGDMSARTYAAVIAGGQAALREGRDVVLDGTFSKRRDRAKAIAMAESAGAEPLVIRCELGVDAIRERLAMRLGEAQRVSDARPELLDRHLERFEPAGQQECGRVIPLDLSLNKPEVCSTLLQRVFMPGDTQ